MYEYDLFVDLIQTYCDESGIDEEPVVDGQCFLSSPDRVIHLRFARERREVTYSSAVYVTGGHEDLILPESIAAFNAWRLFQGGHRLCVDPPTRAVYLSLAEPLERASRSGLAVVLHEFVECCRLCTIWYGAQADRDSAAAADAA